jgi:hypothetical protein
MFRRISFIVLICEAAPPGIETLARFTMLPLQLDENYANVSESFVGTGALNKYVRKYSKIIVFLLLIHRPLVVTIGNKENGTFGVTHATIRAQLDKQIEMGDPVFMVEFSCEAVCFISLSLSFLVNF